MADPRGKQQPAFTQAEIRFVRSTLRRLGVRHELDDAVGDVLLAVSEHLPDYAPSRPRWPWLYAFARFGSLNHHRQTRVRARRELGVPDVEALNMPHRGPDPWASAVTRNRLEILDRLLSELPPEQIEVLLLHDACGMTAAAIASTLALPLGTVTTRLRVARRNIDAARRRIEAQLASHGESLTALPAFALLFDTVETSPGDADEPPSAPGVSAVTPPRVTAAPWMAAGIPALAGVVAVTVASVLFARCDAPAPSPLPVPSAAMDLESTPTDPSPPPTPPSALGAPTVQPPRPRATPSTVNTASPRDDLSPDEVKAQVNAARMSLARADAPGALVTLERLDRRDRRGLFLPYRESLRIEALANLGRLPEARRRLVQLRKATPADPLLLRLDRLLRAPP